MYEDDDDVECLDDPISLIYEEKQRFGMDTDDVIDLDTSSDEETEKPELIPTSNYGKSTLVLPVTFFDVYRNVSLLKKCRPLSIKVVDCDKYPDFGKGNKSDEVIRKELNSTANCDNISPKSTGLSLTQGKDDRTNKIVIGSKGPVVDKLTSEIKQNRMNGNIHVAQDIKMTVEPKDLSQVDFKRNKGLVGLTITTKFPPAKVATEAVGDTQTVYPDEQAERDFVFNSFMKDIGDTLNSLGTIVIPVLEENKNDRLENDTKNDKEHKSSEVSRVNNTPPKQESDKSNDPRDELKLNMSSPTRCSLKITCSKILEKAIKLQEIKVGVNKKPRKWKKDVLEINKKEDTVKLNLKRKTPDSADFFIVDDIKRSHDRIKKHKNNNKKDKLEKNKTKMHAQSDPAPLNTSCINLNMIANDAKLNQNSPIPIPDYNQHQVVEALPTSNTKKYQKNLKLSKMIPGKNKKSKSISMREAESISELIISQVKSSSEINVINNSTNVLNSNVSQLPQNNSILLTFPKRTKKSTTTTDNTTVFSESKKTDENKTTQNLNNTQSAPTTVLNCNQNHHAVNQFNENCRMDMNQTSLNSSGAPNNAMSNAALLKRHYANIPGNKILTLRGSTPPLHFLTSNPKNPGFPIETIVNNRPVQEKQVKFIAPWPYPPPNTNIATYIPNYRMLNPHVNTPDHNNTYPVYWRPPLRHPPPPYTPTWNNVSNNNPSVKSDTPESSIIGSNADGQLIKKITITATPASEITVKNKEKMLPTINGANNTSKKSLNAFIEKQIQRTEALSKPTQNETVSGSSLKKPKDKVVKPKVVQPSKGYSPPILPIPAYQTVLDILSKSDKSDNNSKQISKIDRTLAKNSKLDHRYDAEALKRKLMSIESGKYDNARKISIEEYKKRTHGDGGNVSNDLKTKCDDKRKMSESVVVDNNLDLGYDSDATVIL